MIMSYGLMRKRMNTIQLSRNTYAVLLPTLRFTQYYTTSVTQNHMSSFFATPSLSVTLVAGIRNLERQPRNALNLLLSIVMPFAYEQ